MDIYQFQNSSLGTSQTPRCVYSAIAACADDIQEELALTRFVVNIKQLNVYCDKMTAAHRCILSESETCPAELRTPYAQTVKAEQNVLKDLCRPGPFQEEYLREAACVAEIYSERSATPATKGASAAMNSATRSDEGPCRKQYSRFLHAAFETARVPKNSASKEQAKNLNIQNATSTLQNLCCAYYSVYECTQAHAGRCGGLSRAKFPLRQIYQGLEHNCRPFKPACSISIKHPPPPHRPGGYGPGSSGHGGLGGGKKAKPRPLPGVHSGPTDPSGAITVSPKSTSLGVRHCRPPMWFLIGLVQLMLFILHRTNLSLDKSRLIFIV
ncbi:hypothetical protein BIW11_08368 [Tropilaelaps mercedesae]|uniref:Uncharacterized protein n=1 Tax=Tropilaelaps mercedesae TaxID=418985 RepID=A0A1V9XQ09_9ACAR|nr:hypothetical protein BIW11_08368 [Tropilaelaps mercedesae]